jgi:hypothetical protein
MRWHWLSAGALALLIAYPALTDPGEKPERPEAEYIKVEIKGVLLHNLVAIGGETTGTEITAKGITWELDLRKKKEFGELAENLDKKTALVTGTLERRKGGVERPERWVVTVTALKAPGERKPASEK